MSWKVRLLAITLGIGIEIFVAYFLNAALGLTFLQNIDWTSRYAKYVLGFFFGGFLSACWLFYWIKLCHHFFHSPTQATPVVSQITTKHMGGVSTPTTAVPPQSHAEPVAQPALAPQEQADSVIQPFQQAHVESGTSESFQSPSVSKPVEPVSAPSPSQAPVAPAVPGVRPKSTLTPPKPMSVQTSPMHPAVASASPQQMGVPLGGGLSPVSSVSTGPAGGVPLTATGSVSANSVSQKAQDIESLMHIDDTLDMAVFKKVALEGQVIDLVYSSDNDAVICKLLSEAHDWVVDIISPIENSVWRNEIGETLTIGATVLKQAALLEKIEPDASILPTIVLMRGTIQNYDAVANYLLQNHIHLVKYQADEAENVVTLHQMLKKYFSIFPDIPIDDEENEEEYSEDETNDLTEQ